jgi:8-oxo-dGTP pyrophosphatase MutT (NUDIX family)
MAERTINVRGIIYKDGKLFAQQLTPDHLGNERDFWCTPGGGLDDNEPLVEGLKREMIEETGVEPVIGKLLFIQQFTDGSRENLEFFFHIENVNDYENIDISKTSHGELEIKQVGFIDPSTNDLLPKFLQTVDILDYITNDKPVFTYNSLLK